MLDPWEYLRISPESDLSTLGAEGWELVAAREMELIFKRRAADPTARFTLEQKERALADIATHQRQTRHLLNPDIADLIRRVNHTQMLLIADRGFPIPNLPRVADISLTADIPTVPQVLVAILPDFPVDRLILAEEQQAAAPDRWEDMMDCGLPVETMSHLTFKRYAASAVACIRTGDSTPFANVLLVGG